MLSLTQYPQTPPLLLVLLPLAHNKQQEGSASRQQQRSHGRPHTSTQTLLPLAWDSSCPLFQVDCQKSKHPFPIAASFPPMHCWQSVPSLFTAMQPSPARCDFPLFSPCCAGCHVALAAFPQAPPFPQQQSSSSQVGPSCCRPLQLPTQPNSSSRLGVGSLCSTGAAETQVGFGLGV